MPNPIHISDLFRAECRRINWKHVHLAADKRLPFASQHPLTKRDYVEEGR